MEELNGGHRPERYPEAVLTAPERVAAVLRARATASRGLADRLARLVAEGVGAPIALLSLVDADQQIVLGSFGSREVRETGQRREIMLERSLCDAVVTAGIPLIVSDAHRDRSIADVPAVREHGLGAYVGFPVRDADGQIVGVLAVADHRPRDWSARELTVIDDAAQLFTAGLAGEIDRDRRNLPRTDGPPRLADAVLDNLTTGVAACDLDGRVILVNRVLREILGGPGDQRPDLPVEEWGARGDPRHPDGRPYAPEEFPLRRALRGERLHDVDIVLRLPDGSPRTFTVNAGPVVDPSGDRIGGVLTAEDVTTRRRAERLQSCELAVAQALAGHGDLTDAATTVLEEIATVLGWPHAQLWLTDERTGTLTAAARWDLPGWRAPVEMPTEIAHGEGLAGAVWATGTPMWIPDVATDPLAGPLADQAGRGAWEDRPRTALAVPVRSTDRTVGVIALYGTAAEEPQSTLVAVLLGIAGQVGQFLERLRSAQEVTRLARSEQEYLALVGHELRTPLTTMTAYTELLCESPDEATLGSVRDLLGIVTRNTTLLLDTVENLLDLAALESGTAALEFEPVDLAQLVRERTAVATPTARRQGIALVTQLPERLVLLADQDRMGQVIDHLLTNAIRHSPEGGRIDVTVTRAASAALLTVADTGMGIPDDEADKVTGHFYRSSRSREAGLRGTGLGLALTTAVVERHGGALALGSRQPQGTTVTVRLPLRGGPDQASGSAVRAGTDP